MTAKNNLFDLENKWFALAVFLIISLTATFPVFKNIDYLGTGDWDQHFFYNAVPRETMLKFHQIPLWNPYYCGGNVLLAHPESVWLSPMFLLVLIFGTVIGLKIQILIHLIIGMFGMFLLSKYYKMGKYSSYMPSIIFMLSTWYVSRMMVGHSLYMTMVYLPYIFLFYLKSFKKIKYAIVSALILAIVFFGGGTYPFVFTLLFLGFFSLFRAIKKKSIVPFKSLIIIIILTLLFGAVKFLPVYEFVKNSYRVDDVQPVSIKTFIDGLVSRNQHPNSRFFYSKYEFPVRWYQDGTLYEEKTKVDMKWGWHEYSAYIGIIPVLIFILSLFFLFKKNWDLILTTAVFLVLYLGNNLYFYDLLKKLPVLGTLHGSSRFIIVIIFCMSILIGKMLSYFEKKNIIFVKKNIKKYILIIISLIVLADLITMNFLFFGIAFFIKPEKITAGKEFYPIIGTDKYNEQYRNFLQNKGTINCYERIHPPIAAEPRYLENGTRYEDYRGEVYLLKNKGIISLEYFSPNKIKVKVDAKQDDILVLNQNYFKGWKAKGKEIKQYNGLVATEVGPYDKEVVFYYMPNSFIIDLIVSIISIISAIIFMLIKKKKTN